MKPVAFDYARAGDVAEALALLGQADGAGKILAGGQSLGPMLNLRLVRPGLLVDIRHVEPLRAVEETEAALIYGAAVTHAEIEDGAVPDGTRGMMRHVAADIAYRAVRNRGTIGGALAHADPAADWIAALWALGARVRLAGPAGGRDMPIWEFLQGAFTTALADDEILSRVAVPRLSAGARWGYYKVCRKVGEFADAIGVVVADPDAGICRVVAGALDGPPVFLTETARALARDGRDAALSALGGEAADRLGRLDAVERRLHEVAVARAVNQVFAA